MGRIARRLGEKLREPTVEGLRALEADLMKIEVEGSLEPATRDLLTSTVEAAAQFRIVLEAVEGVPGRKDFGVARLSPGRSGLKTITMDSGVRGKIRGLLETHLPVLRAELLKLARERGALGTEEATQGALWALANFEDHAARKGHEGEGLELLLSGYQLILSARLGRLALGLGDS